MGSNMGGGNGMPGMSGMTSGGGPFPGGEYGSGFCFCSTIVLNPINSGYGSSRGGSLGAKEDGYGGGNSRKLENYSILNL